MEERRGKQKRTHRERSLLEMEQAAPWGRLVTLIEPVAAAPSTKNQAKARGPGMHQTKKGNMWHIGMKAHIGVDAGSGLIHTGVGTAANAADMAQAHALLHGEEKARFGDAGCQNVGRRAEIAGRFGHAGWFVAAKRGKVKALAEGKLNAATEAFEKAKAQMRAHVEHPFHVSG